MFQTYVNGPIDRYGVYTQGCILTGDVPSDVAGKLLKPSEGFNVVRNMYGLSHSKAKKAGLKRDAFHMGGRVICPDGKVVYIQRVWGIVASAYY